MRKNQIIEKVINNAADNFGKSANTFWPAFDYNGFNERNLSFQFAHEFMKRPSSHAFMEVPFPDKITKKHKYRFDAFVFDSSIGIFIECKRLYHKDKYEEILLDLERMNKKNISRIFDEMYRIKTWPKNIFALIIAESWSTDINNWWLGEDSKKRWDRSKIQEGMVFGCQEVGRRNETFYWLHCYRKIPI